MRRKIGRCVAAHGSSLPCEALSFITGRIVAMEIGRCVAGRCEVLRYVSPQIEAVQSGGNWPLRCEASHKASVQHGADHREALRHEIARCVAVCCESTCYGTERCSPHRFGENWSLRCWARRSSALQGETLCFDVERCASSEKWSLRSTALQYDAPRNKLKRNRATRWKIGRCVAGRCAVTRYATERGASGRRDA